MGHVEGVLGLTTVSVNRPEKSSKKKIRLFAVIYHVGGFEKKIYDNSLFEKILVKSPQTKFFFYGNRPCHHHFKFFFLKKVIYSLRCYIKIKLQSDISPEKKVYIWVPCGHPDQNPKSIRVWIKNLLLYI